MKMFKYTGRVERILPLNLPSGFHLSAFHVTCLSHICPLTIPLYTAHLIFWFNLSKLQTSVYFLGFPSGSDGKESACNEGDLGSIPGLGRSSGEGNGYPLQYSGLETSMDYIHSPCGSQRVRHHWMTFTRWHAYPTIMEVLGLKVIFKLKKKKRCKTEILPRCHTKDVQVVPPWGKEEWMRSRGPTSVSSPSSLLF